MVKKYTNRHIALKLLDKRVLADVLTKQNLFTHLEVSEFVRILDWKSSSINLPLNQNIQLKEDNRRSLSS